MKLLKLVLSNFQGVKRLDLELQGNDTTIRGRNGSGKTTVANAVTWLLFDKAATEVKGYTPKTTDENGDDVHFLDHTAEGTFELEDGSSAVLKRDYHEVYTRAKGSNTDTFTGNTTDHYIDGVPVSASQYGGFLKNLYEVEKARMITIPEYFPEQLHWQKRREILLEICGDITDEDIIAASEELSELPKYLQKAGGGGKMYTVSEYAAIARAKKAEINKELTAIPIRIDQESKGITGAPNDSEIQNKIQRIKIELDILAGEKRALQNMGKADLKKQRAEAGAEFADAKSAYIEAVQAQNNVIRGDIEVLNNTLSEVIRTESDLHNALNTEERHLNDIQNRRAKLIREYTSVQEEQPDITAECPTCRQAIPKEQIAAATERFNLNKSKRLEELSNEGAEFCSKEMMAKSEGVVLDITTRLEQEKAKILALKVEISKKQTTLITADFTKAAEYAAITAKIAGLDELMSNDGNHIAEQEATLNAKIRAKDMDLTALQTAAALMASEAASTARIGELSAREKELSAEFEKIEYGVWLAEEFTRKKASMLDEKINSKFETVRFQLFKKNTSNEGIEEICEVLCKTPEGLVPYSKPANTASRLNASLEIIDTLGQHWGIQMPIVIDGAESVTAIRPTMAQQIRLYVDKTYPQLKIV